MWRSPSRGRSWLRLDRELDCSLGEHRAGGAPLAEQLLITTPTQQTADVTKRLRSVSTCRGNGVDGQPGK